MTERLKSYVCGEWVAGNDPSALVNPATEEILAEAGSGGISFKACLEYARDKGNPILRRMTFSQRGELLHRIAKAMHAKREELIELSILNGGNTRSDAKFDIDGATGVLAYYAALSKTLGDKTFLTDKAPEQLGRNPRFVGRHIQTPFTGAAVFINAFNFPAWGFAEKAAVAILAGMPVVSKPATATSLLAYRITQIIVEADILPPGALSFIAGGVGDLLDHLTCQDVLLFTGSSKTALTIRAKQSVIERSVRHNIEADSLNSSILGPDVRSGSATYDLFIMETAKEMTQKAGQKCTATRRIFVPESFVDTVRDDLVSEIKRVKVGNPALKDVQMGPLATRGQLDDVRAGVERLKACAKACLSADRAALGDGGRGTLVGVPDGKGFFIQPALFVATDPEHPVLHGEEIFGPVQTLIPYSGKSEDAVRLSNLGGGGLVASVYSDNADFVNAVVAGIAPFNGRIYIGSEKMAEHSTGPGAVLPQLKHGGPGRAGGGEELGGLLGLSFYIQRTALQGAAAQVAQTTGA